MESVDLASHPGKVIIEKLDILASPTMNEIKSANIAPKIVNSIVVIVPLIKRG